MSYSEKIKVLLVEPKKNPQIAETKNTLSGLQEFFLGDDFEEYMPFSDEVALLCASHGLLERAPPNRKIKSKSGKLITIRGNFVLCGAPLGALRYQSLSEEMVKKYEQRFKI